MIKKEGQSLTYELLENYPTKREIISGRLLCAEEILRTSLFNLGFEKMWELLCEEEKSELKSIVLSRG